MNLPAFRKRGPRPKGDLLSGVLRATGGGYLLQTAVAVAPVFITDTLRAVIAPRAQELAFAGTIIIPAKSVIIRSDIRKPTGAAGAGTKYGFVAFYTSRCVS